MIKMISFYKNIAFFYISKITIHNKQIQRKNETQTEFLMKCEIHWKYYKKYYLKYLKNINVKSKNLLNFNQKIISQLL